MLESLPRQVQQDTWTCQMSVVDGPKYVNSDAMHRLRPVYAAFAIAVRVTDIL